MHDKWIIIKAKRKDKVYVSACISKGFGKGVFRTIGLGSLEELTKLNKEAIATLKNKCLELSTETPNEVVKQDLLNSLSSSVFEHEIVNYGISSLYKMINKLNLFRDLPKTKHKNIEEIIEYIIAKRIIDPSSIIQSFKDKDKFQNDIKNKKTTFYNCLDFVENHKDIIFKSVNNVIASETNRKVNIVFYDVTTVYFETFVRNRFRNPGYSKDGKFKEDQLVVGMVTDLNGIPIHYKLFEGNKPEMKTFVPFVVEMKQKYNLNNVTIVADRGMNINANLRFLESNNIDYIISYRLMSASKEIKESALSIGEYEKNNSFLSKEVLYESNWKKGRLNGKIRKKIYTYSSKRALKDKNDRENLINNFVKKQDKHGIVNIDKMLGSKKCKYFQSVGDSKFMLNQNKILNDEKFDGYYVYETSRIDMTPIQIVETYAKQWQIEENFRTLKSAIQIRPVHVWTNEHIKGYFTLCILSLIVFKYSLYVVNDFLNKNGVIDRITNDRFKNALANANYTVDKVNGKIVDTKKITNSNNPLLNDDYSIINMSFNKYFNSK
ncbi:IS1634 family transposase [Mycoplasmopsis alligatoris]|uniref:Transposase, IS4 family n=1 Tax=Mycoplasmopsis alligatoris A21JP2 TaxID=747682 RepID=D4XVN0_9BACT|nr:IS1634 family transposase [Mycoplasmopsis alligatoris]EFF41640.1 transposase, IS4 family [Mycoplasmopsis alligatoris A21JP2]